MFVLSDELDDVDFAQEVKRIFDELAIRMRKNNPDWKLDDLIKDSGLNDPSMVYAGERVTCVNGHLICSIMENIGSGDQNWSKKLGKWQFEPPERGSQPVCDLCGGKFWSRPGILHLENRGWVSRSQKLRKWLMGKSDV